MGQQNEREPAQQAPSAKGPWHDQKTPVSKSTSGSIHHDDALVSNGLPDSDINEQRHGSIGEHTQQIIEQHTRALEKWYRYTLIIIGFILFGTLIIQIGANRYRMALQKQLTYLHSNATKQRNASGINYPQESKSLAEVLHLLSGIIPARVRLERVTLDTQTGATLTVTGYGRDSNAILSLIESLSMHFDDIDAALESEEEEDEECYFTLSFGLAATSGAHGED